MLPLVKPRAADDDHHYNIIINIIINIVINIIDIKIIIMNIVINIIINMKEEQQNTKTKTKPNTKPKRGALSRSPREPARPPYGLLGASGGLPGPILAPVLKLFWINF